MSSRNTPITANTAASSIIAAIERAIVRGAISIMLSNDLHQRPAAGRSGAAGANCMRWLDSIFILSQQTNYLRVPAHFLLRKLGKLKRVETGKMRVPLVTFEPQERIRTVAQ